MPSLQERLESIWLSHDTGPSYTYDLKHCLPTAPSDKESRSALVVLEDGEPLSLPHQIHSAIRSNVVGHLQAPAPVFWNVTKKQ